MSGPEYGAFLTGSRRYGTPREDSDFDVVVYMDGRDADQLCAEAKIDAAYDLNCSNSTAVRFGRLNLIICFTKEEFDRWRSARDKCITKAPIERSLAVHIHAQKRAGRYSRNVGELPHPPEESDKEVPI